MAAPRGDSPIWRPVKAVVGFPIRVLGGMMAGMGRALNATHYPGAGGDLGVGAPGRSSRRSRRRRRNR